MELVRKDPHRRPKRESKFSPPCVSVCFCRPGTDVESPSACAQERFPLAILASGSTTLFIQVTGGSIQVFVIVLLVCSFVLKGPFPAYVWHGFLRPRFFLCRKDPHESGRDHRSGPVLLQSVFFFLLLWGSPVSWL